VRDVKRALLKKGFREVKKGHDHIFYLFFHGEKKTQILTKLSHGEREIRDPNCSNMAKQMKLSNPQFREFVDCSLEMQHYLKILAEGKHL
jgi:hypothetical protein